MDLKTKIKSLLKEAELYKGQGLLAEARGSYEKIIALVRKNLSPSDGQKVLDNISEKIKGLGDEIRRVEKKVLSPDMSKESQDLITKMFEATEGEDEDAAAMEGAKALIKFGQFERAKKELDKLLNVESRRAEAARHIINCLFLENKRGQALQQYGKWADSGQFTPKQLDSLKRFIEKIFKTKVAEPKPAVKSGQDNIIELDKAKVNKAKAAPAAQKPAPKPVSPKPKVAAPVPEKEDSEDFEEFDIMASIKKSKKPDKKK